ncbi:MAG: hypothetical protein QOJ86_988 [Bradyrhizobium sp.]|jgi:hypothetical protein|nr:hypothetical protein [Bradyrhizobium sp.]
MVVVNPAFLGHGIWLELAPIDGLQRYAKYKKPLPANPPITKLVDKFIEAITDMKMSSVWLELFTRSGTIDKNNTKATKELVDGLKAANINAIPWGYCFGKNSEKADPSKNDLELAKTLCDKYKLDVFVADIEPWNKIGDVVDKWKADALEKLMTGLNAHFGKENIGISSFANLDKQPKAREFLVPVAPLVSFCAPQIYWNKRKPIDWAEKSLKSWRDAGVTTELIATVQSYWELQEGTGTREQMTTKVDQFETGFPDSEWAKIVGLNWYHAGGTNDAASGGMTQEMIDSIIAGKLDQKPYRKP